MQLKIWHFKISKNIQSTCFFLYQRTIKNRLRVFVIDSVELNHLNQKQIRLISTIPSFTNIPSKFEETILSFTL